MPLISNSEEPTEDSLKCEIRLTGNKWAFKTGENIEGSLLVTNHKEIQCYAISVNLEGKAMVKFQDGNTVHWDEENLITASCYVYGKRLTVKRMLLKEGEHEFQFSFQVLPTCHYPSSFTSSHGAIVYQLVAYIQTYAGSNKKDEKIIILQGNYMLDPSKDEPIRFTRSPPMFPALVPSKIIESQLKVVIQLEKNGYLPGECLNFILRLDNPQKQNVYTMSVKIVLFVNFYSGDIQKSISRILMAKETHSRISSENKLTWKDFINVPKGFIAPSCTNIIENQYFLQVEIFTNDSNNDKPTIEKIPIFIGTGRKIKDSDDIHRADLKLFYSPLT